MAAKLRHHAAKGGGMNDNPDRQAFVLGLVATALGAALRPASALAASGAIPDQPWAVWDKNDKPVRGGYFRVAAELSLPRTISGSNDDEGRRGPAKR
jgi:hypothetical protein